MRIGTWNLERGGRGGVVTDIQGTILSGLRADVLVLTEPHTSSPIPLLSTVASPAGRMGNGEEEPWVAIAGPSVSPLSDDVPPFERLSVAALAELNGTPAVVYGSVLPWRQIARQAPDLVRPNETYAEAFRRILGEQVADLMRFRAQLPDHTLIWAGDFNQSLVGPNLTGSKTGRDQLTTALRRLDLVAWNSDSPHSKSGMRAIDLACGPDLDRASRIELISTHQAERKVSDHVGYVVEF
jgi:hypothetical protein